MPYRIVIVTEMATSKVEVLSEASTLPSIRSVRLVDRIDFGLPVLSALES